MFSYYYNLNNLKLSSFDTKNVAKIDGIFYNSEKVLESNFSTFKKFEKTIMTNI